MGHIEAVFQKFQTTSRDNLIPILQEIQQEIGFLSEEAIIKVSAYLKIPTSKVYAVATFYNQFRFIPRAKFRIKLCAGTACHITGAETILDHLEKRLNIKAGETSTNGLVSLEISQCIGACGLAPAILVNDKFYPEFTTEKIDEIIDFVNSKVEN